jgi:hypothetical protein
VSTGDMFRRHRLELGPLTNSLGALYGGVTETTLRFLSGSSKCSAQTSCLRERR